MNRPTPHMHNEADIGSGEKTPGEHETEEEIRRIGRRTPAPDQDSLNDARAQQQMIEANVNTTEEFKRIAQKHANKHEDRDARGQAPDPLPPKGN